MSNLTLFIDLFGKYYNINIISNISHNYKIYINIIIIKKTVETLVDNSYTTKKGAVNGLATLDASGKITSSQLNTLINSIGGLSTAGLIGRTVEGAAEIITLTTAAKSLFDDNTISAIRSTLELGTAATTAATAYQPNDSNLTAIAALSSNGIIEKTGSGTAAIIAATDAGKAIITAADVAAQKLLLGIDASGNTYQPIDADLTGISALSETSSVGLINRTAGGITTVATSDFAPAAHVGATGSAHGVAVTGTAGFMSSSDKAKLDGIASGATANTGTVTSVLVPWNTCGAYNAGVLGVPTVDYFIYAIFNWISPFMTLTVAALGIKIKQLKQ